MAYPPTVPPNSRTDATPSVTNHPGDHNAISAAFTDIINELGADPSGTFPTVQARLDATKVVDFGWVTGGVGSQTAGGLYDLVFVDQGQTKTFPCRIYLQANFQFGFGGAGPCRCGFDIFRFLDNTTNNQIGAANASPAAAVWSTVSQNWGWSVPAGSQYGFKLRSNLLDTGAPGGNCYMGASALYWLVHDG